MIAALAPLPENDVHLGLENLEGIADEMPFWTIPLLEYVERVHVGSEGLAAQFPPSTWNIHLQTLQGDHRTNNLCEGWTNKFARLV